jgi:hypothetical protein
MAQPETITQWIIPSGVGDTMQVYQDLLKAVHDELLQDDRNALRVRILVFNDAHSKWGGGEIVALEPAEFETSLQQRRKEIDAFFECLIDALNSVFGNSVAASMNHEILQFLSSLKLSHHD